MASCPSRLSAIQREIRDGFFRLQRGFVLTGGAALAGFHLGHRESQDLDLFAREPLDLELASRSLRAAAAEAGVTCTMQVSYPQFRRILDVDSMREITANKVTALVGRAEIRDLVDLKFLLDSGMPLERAMSDAERKDGGTNAATLAWLLDQLTIMDDAHIPAGLTAVELERFRADLVCRLRRMAYPTDEQRPS